MSQIYFIEQQQPRKIEDFYGGAFSTRKVDDQVVFLNESCLGVSKIIPWEEIVDKFVQDGECVVAMIFLLSLRKGTNNILRVDASTEDFMTAFEEKVKDVARVYSDLIVNEMKQIKVQWYTFVFVGEEFERYSIPPFCL